MTDKTPLLHKTLGPVSAFSLSLRLILLGKPVVLSCRPLEPLESSQCATQKVPITMKTVQAIIKLIGFSINKGCISSSMYNASYRQLPVHQVQSDETSIAAIPTCLPCETRWK